MTDGRTARGTAWSVTCNLKNVSRVTVDSCMDAARQLGWGVEGQLERGAEGTEHYQLMVRTPQVRFAAVKKVFPTAHIELARNRTALEQYVHKEDTRVEPLKSIEVTFLTYPQVRSQFFKWLVGRKFFDVLASDPDDRLRLWDEFIGLSIEEGMHVDLIGMNPQHRGCISKYWRHYIAYEYSSRQPEVRSQSDSQTPENVVAVTNIPNANDTSHYTPSPSRARPLQAPDVSSSTVSQQVSVPVQSGTDVYGNVHRKPDSV